LARDRIRLSRRGVLVSWRRNGFRLRFCHSYLRNLIEL
jgi:hypothetical protein